LARLARESFDLLVIGGGINGGGIARDAALRGLSVALVEMGEFASGTSSRSSRLVHGGLRYLEHGEFRLVREASLQRERLRRPAPDLVVPIEFLIPIYRGDQRGRFQLAIGLWAYDILAGFKNVRRHRMLGRDATLAIEPHLARDSLRGGALYYDCWT